MKKLILLSITALTFSAFAEKQATVNFDSRSAQGSDRAITLQANDFSTWPGADAQEFGCFLEKKFGTRDKKFNCSLEHYENHGDPCKNTKEYYEGPSFPPNKASHINHRIASVDLAWEHGALQSVSVLLDKKYSEKQIRTYFKLPAKASIQDCTKRNSCIVLEGFDHQGSGDVECNNQLKGN
jgi:hypothetical protein